MNIKDKNGHTPLDLAEQSHLPEAVQALFPRLGPGFKLKDRQETVNRILAVFDRRTIIQYLAEQSATSS